MSDIHKISYYIIDERNTYNFDVGKETCEKEYT